MSLVLSNFTEIGRLPQQNNGTAEHTWRKYECQYNAESAILSPSHGIVNLTEIFVSISSINQYLFHSGDTTFYCYSNPVTTPLNFDSQTVTYSCQYEPDAKPVLPFKNLQSVGFFVPEDFFSKDNDYTKYYNDHEESLKDKIFTGFQVPENSITCVDYEELQSLEEVSMLHIQRTNFEKICRLSNYFQFGLVLIPLLLIAITSKYFDGPLNLSALFSVGEYKCQWITLFVFVQIFFLINNFFLTSFHHMALTVSFLTAISLLASLILVLYIGFGFIYTWCMEFINTRRGDNENIHHADSPDLFGILRSLNQEYYKDGQSNMNIFIVCSIILSTLKKSYMICSLMLNNENIYIFSIPHLTYLITPHVIETPHSWYSFRSIVSWIFELGFFGLSLLLLACSAGFITEFYGKREQTNYTIAVLRLTVGAWFVGTIFFELSLAFQYGRDLNGLNDSILNQVYICWCQICTVLGICVEVFGILTGKLLTSQEYVQLSDRSNGNIGLQTFDNEPTVQNPIFGDGEDLEAATSKSSSPATFK